MSSDEDERPPNQLLQPLSYFQLPQSNLISSSMGIQERSTSSKPYQLTFSTREEEIQYTLKLMRNCARYNGDPEQLVTWLKETGAFIAKERYPETDHPFIIRHLLLDDALDYYMAHDDIIFNFYDLRKLFLNKQNALAPLRTMSWCDFVATRTVNSTPPILTSTQLPASTNTESDENCFRRKQSNDVVVLKQQDSSYTIEPEGTESWHIHEIKPQRPLVSTITDTEQLMTATPITIVVDERLPAESQVPFGPHPLAAYPIEPNLFTTYSIVLNPLTSLRCTLPNVNPHDLLRKKLSSLVGAHLALFCLIVLSILVRFGIAYHPVHTLPAVNGHVSTFESTFIVDTIPTIRSRQHVHIFTPYVKTIEKLRNLESLLIYAVT
jgi:hypothetical protein